MQIRPFLIKIRLKFKALAARYRPRISTLPTAEFFAKRWIGASPNHDYFEVRKKPGFFIDPTLKEEYQLILKKRFSESCDKIIASADKIIENKFDLLGSGEIHLGSSIDWQMDFKSGFKWPLKHFSEIAIVDLSNNADVKVPWELSRLQFLITLGRAFVLTGDTRFKDKFVAVLNNWLRENPVDYGVNWTCSMEVAIRAINIIWAVHFFALNHELTNEFLRECIKSIYYHALHIEKNLEFIDEGSNTNHLLTNYLGLFYIGLLFPEFDRANKWLSIGKKGLEKEILYQVGEDGADYECSTSYHRLVMEILLSFFVLARKNNIELSETIEPRLIKMAEFSAATMAQSGKTTPIGDNDDGFIIKLSSDDPHNHRPLLDIASQILNVKVPTNIARSEERLWYLGFKEFDRWPKMAHRKPKLFKESGYAIVQNDNLHLVFNAAGIPINSFGGHKHNDLLTLTLEIDSVPFLIDAGTGCYTSDYKLRNSSRSTFSHNTISIDESEQSRFMEKALFFMFRDAHPKIDLWTVTDDIVLVSGTHDGYARLGGNIIHRRTVETSLKKNAITIWDEITGNDSKEHLIESRFLTPWKCTKANTSPGVTIEAENGNSLSIEFKTDKNCHTQIIPSNYFPRYGILAKGNQIACKCRTILPFKIETSLTYHPADSLTSVSDPIKTGQTESRIRTLEKTI